MRPNAMNVEERTIDEESTFDPKHPCGAWLVPDSFALRSDGPTLHQILSSVLLYPSFLIRLLTLGS